MFLYLLTYILDRLYMGMRYYPAHICSLNETDDKWKREILTWYLIYWRAMQMSGDIHLCIVQFHRGCTRGTYYVD